MLSPVQDRRGIRTTRRTSRWMTYQYGRRKPTSRLVIRISPSVTETDEPDIVVRGSSGEIIGVDVKIDSINIHLSDPSGPIGMFFDDPLPTPWNRQITPDMRSHIGSSVEERIYRILQEDSPILLKPAFSPLKPLRPLGSLPESDTDRESAELTEPEVSGPLHKLELMGWGSVANSIRQFLELAEPDDPPFLEDSLKCLASFLAFNPVLSSPIVGADLFGHVELEWHLHSDIDSDTQNKGVVSLRFLETGVIQFVALSKPYREGTERTKLLGKSSPEHIMEELGSFANRIKGE